MLSHRQQTLGFVRTLRFASPSRPFPREALLASHIDGTGFEYEVRLGEASIVPAQMRDILVSNRRLILSFSDAVPFITLSKREDPG